MLDVVVATAAAAAAAAAAEEEQGNTTSSVSKEGKVGIGLGVFSQTNMGKGFTGCKRVEFCNPVTIPTISAAPPIPQQPRPWLYYTTRTTHHISAAPLGLLESGASV
jgi:hypothetical protein